MRFSEVSKGTYARRSISLEMNGAQVALDIRVLSSDEEADALKGALEYAKEHGMTTAEAGDPLYDLGLWIHTAAVACVDSSSPADAPRPFFDGGVDQIRNSAVLTRTHLAFLYEHQEVWQNEVSPYERILDNDALMGRMYAVADGDLRPFVALPPRMRWLFVRGLAARHVTLLAAKSLSGSLSTPNETDVVEAEN